VNAHTRITGFIGPDGKSTMECVRPRYPGFVPETKLGEQWPIQQSNLLSQGILSDNYTCGFLPFGAQPAPSKCTVAAGSNVAVSYYHGPGATEDPVKDLYIAASHKGPFFAYMAKSDTGKGNVWFKIFQEGKIKESSNFDSVQWASPDTLLANGGQMKFKIPGDITPGNYLLRTEIIAMHDTSPSGSQPYVHCVELTVTGGGSVNPAGVAIPGTVQQNDPGLSTQYSIYRDYQKPYPFPGPAVYVPGQVQPTTKTSSTTTVTPATTQIPVEVPVINAIVTVKLPIAPKSVDINSFIYEVTQVLDISYAAITAINVDIDQSSDTDSVTVIHFTITNVLDEDGYTRVNPITAAEKLRDMANSKDAKLSNTAMLANMQVLDISEVSASQPAGDFVNSAAFVIMICVIGGALIIAVAVSVVVIILKRRKNADFM